MNTMIMTTNSLTVKRMAVIAKRTQNTLMAGAKAIMIENLKKQLMNGVAHFIYTKKNGEIREAFGTLNKAIVAKTINGRGCSREYVYTTAYFDIEKGEWRSFRWENIVSVL